MVLLVIAIATLCLGLWAIPAIAAGGRPQPAVPSPVTLPQGPMTLSGFLLFLFIPCQFRKTLPSTNGDPPPLSSAADW